MSWQLNAPLLAFGGLSARFGIVALVIVALLAMGVIGYLLRKRNAVVLALVRHPFAKYVVLSVVAHLILAVWLLTSRWFDKQPLPPGSATVIVDVGGQAEPFQASDAPWDNPPTEVAPGTLPDLPEPAPTFPPVERPIQASESDPSADSPLPDLDSLVQETPEQSAALPPMPVDMSPAVDADASAPAPEPITSTLPWQDESTSIQDPPNSDEPAATLSGDIDTTSLEDPTEWVPPEDQTVEQDAPAPESVASAKSVEPETPFPSPAKTVQTALQPVSAASKAAVMTPIPKVGKHRADGKALPAIYRDRWAPDRMAIARARGGSEETEAAVRAALHWLAQVQRADGRWDASQFGSGQPVSEGGHDRGNAGINADTATTGLALLAFLGSGHTQLEGEYADTVQRGLQFLIRSQQARSDGSLVGQATGYAAMYCHGIATLALSEAYSLTGDGTLRQGVHDAIRFTLAAQHPSGGWRYRPQEPGDTSQLGWQLMALTSAHYGGFQPLIAKWQAWQRAGRFLRTVARGRHDGLASYRPDTGPTRPMTAEALLCRLMLNTPPQDPSIREAADYLMGDLPGRGRVNYYYWYYGTLGLYHLQDHHWDRWNQALTRKLISLQDREGSWPVSGSVWGNAGGKVYTTAIAAMTLEVYYRYRPLAEKHRANRVATGFGHSSR